MCPKTHEDGDDVQVCEVQQAYMRRPVRGNTLGMRVAHGSTALRVGRLRVRGW